MRLWLATLTYHVPVTQAPAVVTHARARGAFVLRRRRFAPRPPPADAPPSAGGFVRASPEQFVLRRHIFKQ